MLSKNRVKFIISLQKKKVRDEERLYVIEGDKLVKEYLMSGIRIRSLIAKPEFINSVPEDLKNNIDEIEAASYDDLKRVSTLKTPHNALALITVPQLEFNPSEILSDLCAALSFIQDPGNLGTIIRAAAWFGIKNIVCSTDCVDVYNPKVIQASMGAGIHVKVYYSDLGSFLNIALKKGIPVYGTMLDGESIYSHKLGNKGVILLGNESKGISDNLNPFISEKIRIPKFNNSKYGIDSLNVGMAASVIFSEFARRKKKST
ncbi:MAG TPA: RNA methyltransferase [Bacteroidales bacterium]|nr:RNA methyltransferase [Bacteroidales bacterium]